MLNWFFLFGGMILMVFGVAIFFRMYQLSIYHNDKSIIRKKRIGIGLIIISILFWITLFQLPQPDGYLEKIDIPIDYDIQVPDGYKIITLKEISPSKWLWSKNYSHIVYKVIKE